MTTEGHIAALERRHRELERQIDDETTHISHDDMSSNQSRGDRDIAISAKAAAWVLRSPGAMRSGDCLSKKQHP